ncbi:ABC transporter ATP-binding protein [Falsiroseomonas oryzae]|uniref:ABC transporter ATP-binding protein n=1 Tax=Falsiroseomonas oryzae TaxID=2766473 RepID=UPI0022EAD87F|nr:ABC transporter ATP-binding protein [Roseomonas sp. MO-31]
MSAPPSPTIVAFRDVNKTYDGRVRVVRDLNLEVRRGEFLTLLGPSGSGKTTTLMMLAGFEGVTSGSIEVEGRSVLHLPPHRRDIGMVFQNYALFPHMTVAENVAFPLEVRKVPAAEAKARVERALQMVRLPGYADRRPAQLSGGQQQRVALARALVFEPRLVLLDEPLGALDRQLREQMQYELKRLHAELGVTMVYVTHDQSEALTMSDRVAVFSEGVVQQVAAATELYEQPATAFVAFFVGESNRLDGTVLTTGEGGCTVRAAGDLVVQVQAVVPLAPGSAATMSLRPERVRLGNAAESCANRVQARVTEIVFLGDQIRGHAALPGGAELLFKLPNSGDGPRPAPGETLGFGWHAADCRAYPSDRESPP